MYQRIKELNEEVAALKIIQKDYREIVEHATEVIFKVDAAGSFYFVSSEFGRVLGYTHEEMMGKHFTSIIHPEEMQLCVDTFRVLAKFGKAENNIIFRVRHASGDYKWVDCSAVCLFDDYGIPSHSIGFAHDITELVKSQKLLEIESQRYVEATKAVAQAVVDAQEKERADIGYELHDNVNQILSTARLYLDLARNDKKERLSLIARSSASIASAVSEIRNISRSLVPGSISDLGLIASIEDLVESVQLTKKIQVEFNNTGAIDTVASDKQKLMLFRIVQEQVSNVLKHANASLLVIELAVDKGFMVLSISDNGKGFDKEKIKSKKGVGLYNIANRTELFNGRINMVTSPGKGCKLKILIPV